MKRFQKIAFLTIISICLLSCNRNKGGADNRAEEMCDCVKLSENYKKLDGSPLSLNDLDDFEDEDSEKIATCSIDVLKNIDSDLQKLDKQEQKMEYTRKLLKAWLDTECSEKGLMMIPYDMLGTGISEMEKMLKRSKSRREYYEEEYDPDF